MKTIIRVFIRMLTFWRLQYIYWLLWEELLDSASRGTVVWVAFGQATHIKILVILGNLKPAK